MQEPDYVKPIEVTALLKKSQQVDNDRWVAKYNGELTYHPNQAVHFRSMSLEAAIKILDPDECEWIRIEYGDVPYF